MSQPQPFRFTARIRYIDTDASGRIHYTAMFRYFESAEIEFLRTLDFTYGKGHYAFPRVHMECDFMLSIVHDDLIEIEVCLTKLGRSSIRFEFRAFKEGDLAAKGAVVIVCMDRRTQRAASIPNDLRARLATVLSNSAEPAVIGG